jgi:hypothetical protein
MVLLEAKTPYILAHAYVEDHSLAHQKWYEPVRSPWDSVPDNTVRHMSAYKGPVQPLRARINQERRNPQMLRYHCTYHAILAAYK